jgi:hypothetical protein
MDSGDGRLASANESASSGIAHQQRIDPAPWRLDVDRQHPTTKDRGPRFLPGDFSLLGAALGVVRLCVPVCPCRKLYHFLKDSNARSPLAPLLSTSYPPLRIVAPPTHLATGIDGHRVRVDRGAAVHAAERDETLTIAPTLRPPDEINSPPLENLWAIAVRGNEGR